MRKLLILTLALTVVLGVFAQDKLTSSTQMFLYHRAQQAQRATLPPVSPSGRHPLSAALRSNINPKFDAKKMQIWAEPIIIDGVEMIDAFITVDDINNLSPLEAKGVIVEAKFTDFITSKIPIDRIVEISELDCVRQIEVSRMARVKTDIASDITNTTKVWNGTDNGLPENFKGEGVVVGVIDQGIDFQHIAFKDENGNYRIKAAYLSGATSGGSTVTLNGRTISGRQYTGSQLSSLTYDVNDGSHGTHTSSTAGGSTVTVDANHIYTGMAPKSDLVLCGLSSLSNTNIANSVKYINNYATTNNQPCVINISLGSNYGPCDGTGYLTQAYSDFTGNGEAEGRVICLAAGNEGEIIEHISGTATSSTPICTSLEFNIYSDVLDGCSYEYGYTDDTHDIPSAYTIWSQTANVPLKFRPVIIDKSNNSIVYTYNSIVTPTSSNGSTYSLGSNYLKYNSGAASIVIARSLDEYSNKYCYSISVNSDNQNNVTEVGDNYFPHYAVGLLIYSDTDTRVDCWAEYPSSYMSPTYAGTYGGNSFVSGNYDCSIGDDVPAKGVISIGAYVERRVVTTSGGTSYTASEYTIGDIAPFSSFSTNSPDGKIYPHICAPGAVLTAGVNRYDTSNYPSSSTTADEYMTIINHSDGSRYGSMSGTSMATPTATGIVALWLQADPTLTANRVMEVMDATGVRDDYVTSGANKTHFGRWGKIDALAGIEEILGGVLSAPWLNEASSVGTTQFTASWREVAEADSYTLEIGKAAAEPTVLIDGSEGVRSWSTSGNVVTNIASPYTQLGNTNGVGAVTNTFNLNSTGKITVVIVAKPFSNDVSKNVPVKVSCGSSSKTFTLGTTGNDETLTTVLDASSGSNTLKIEATTKGSRPWIKSVMVYSGDVSSSSGAPRLRAVSDVTDGDVRTISGITGTSHVVTGLEAGATYKFKVKAVSGTDESRWSNEETVKTLEGDPVPEFDVDPSSLTMKATVGESATATVDVYGLNLTQNASLTIGGTDATLFSVTPNTLTPAQAAELTTVTVTYSPTAVGAHTATLTIASEGATSVVIPITATATAPALVVYNPVMTTATDAQIGTTEFTATWTDETAAENVSSYTLYVNKYVAPTTQVFDDLLNRATTGITGTSYSTWSGKTGNSGAVYAGQSAGGNESIQLRSSNSNSGIVTTSSPGKVKKVKVTWNSSTQSGRTLNVYGKNSAYSAATDLYGDSKGTLLGSIVYGTSTELTIDGDYEYVGVRSAADPMYLTDITFTWEVPASLSGAPRLRATEMGDASTRTISGIDANTKQYTVQNLTAGAVYDYYVKANYTNGESANSNTERVTLKSAPTPELVADETLTFEVAVNATASKTLNVLGSDLTGDVTLTLTDASGFYSLSSSTITKADAEAGADITVTYSPTAAGTHNAKITISSDGAEDVTVALTGTATGPTLEVDPTTLSFEEVLVNENEAKTVDVYGYNLTGNMSLAISGDNASMFTVSDDSFTPDAGGDVSETVTITYAPTAVGTHTATLTISSAGAQNVTVALSGSGVILTDAPVMADADDVTSTSFKAVWTDATAAAYVRDYTLYVNKVKEVSEPILTETFANCDNDATTNIANSLNNYTDNSGWSGSYLYEAAGGLKFGSSSNAGVLTTPALDLSSSGGQVTVKFNAKRYSESENTISIKNGNNSVVTKTLTDAAGDYIAVIGCSEAANQTITFTGSKRCYVYHVEVYLGDASQVLTAAGAPRLKEVVEAGDADDDGLVVTGITAKEYTVNDLTAGETYEFYVKANYIDDSNAQSNKKEVTLPDNAPRLAVDPASLTFDEQYTGVSTQKTFSVSGANLSGNVTLSVSGDYFTVEPSTLTPTNGTLESTTVTVTYLPTAVGSHTATVTISSAGATSAEVALSGSAVLQKDVPVMSAADTETEVGDTWFDAMWTDETPADNVSSYTLYVNKVEETPEPEPETGVWLAKEDFSNFKGAENGTQIGTSTNPFDNVMATAGWTGTTVYSYNGALRIGSGGNGGTLESPYFDLTDYETVTVKVQVSKNNKAADKSLTINLCDGNNNDNVVDTKSQALTQVQVTAADFATAVPEYSFTLDCSTLTTNAYISFSVESSTQANFRYINIYAGSEPASGAPRLKEVVEDGDASTRTITGISGGTKTYRVSGLTPGAKYDYKVKAVYVDEAESDWSNVEQVTLKLTPHTLAEMVADGTLGVGDSYAIADGNLLAVALSADGKTLFCKDANGYAQKQSASGSQVDYMVEYGFETPLEYDQSNWVALTSESALSGDLVGSYLTGVSGTVSDLANPSLALAAAPAVGESGSAYLSGTPNRFIPTSFMGESVIESGGKVFFFVTPKPVEVAIVTWACWNGSKFVSVPKTTYTKDGVTSTMNPYNLQGEFTVDTKYLKSWPTLTKDEVYEFTAVITREGGSSPAPGRLKSATSAGGYGIYPLSAPTSIGSVGGTVTGITGVNGNGAAVESVTIYNSVGVRQSELQRGVNIIVTRYTDGTTRTVKILK